MVKRIIDTVLLRTHNVCFILNQIDMIINICVGCSKEPSHWYDPFEFPQHMFSAMLFHILDTLHYSFSLSTYSWHEATWPFICQISAIPPTEFHILDTSHYSFSLFGYRPVWSHKTFFYFISNCRYFIKGISHIRHITFSHTGRHETTRPFFFISNCRYLSWG